MDNIIAQAAESPIGRLLVQCLVVGACAGILLARIEALDGKVTEQGATISRLDATVQARTLEMSRLSGKLDDVLTASVDRLSEGQRDLQQRMRSLELERARK